MGLQGYYATSALNTQETRGDCQERRRSKHLDEDKKERLRREIPAKAA